MSEPKFKRGDVVEYYTDKYDRGQWSTNWCEQLLVKGRHYTVANCSTKAIQIQEDKILISFPVEQFRLVVQ